MTFSFQAAQVIDLFPGDGRLARTRVVSWKLAAEMKESVESDALVMPRSSGRPVAGRSLLRG